MSYREIRVIGDPVLRTPCEWITDIDDHVKHLVEDLLENVDQEGRAGLAAPQIGVGLRAFSWNIDGDIGYVLNPKLVEVSEDALWSHETQTDEIIKRLRELPDQDRIQLLIDVGLLDALEQAQ